MASGVETVKATTWALFKINTWLLFSARARLATKTEVQKTVTKRSSSRC